jgi:hypothetical protein
VVVQQRSAVPRKAAHIRPSCPVPPKTCSCTSLESTSAGTAGPSQAGLETRHLSSGRRGPAVVISIAAKSSPYGGVVLSNLHVKACRRKKATAIRTVPPLKASGKSTREGCVRCGASEGVCTAAMLSARLPRDIPQSSVGRHAPPSTTSRCAVKVYGANDHALMPAPHHGPPGAPLIHAMPPNYQNGQ